MDRSAGAVGACGAADGLVVSHVMLHAWEEPPISGDAGSGAVFFPGCSLGCAYCQNRAISRGVHGRACSEEELAQTFLQLESDGAMNVNLVTPTHFAPHLRRAVSLARSRGLSLPVVWNTSGYETVEAIRANAGIVDAYLTDFKYVDARLAAELSHAPDYPEVAMAALHAMVEQVGSPIFDELGGCERMVGGVIVRHLVLPGQVDASCKVLDALWDGFGNRVRLSIMSQYTPLIAEGDPVLAAFPELARKVSEEEYEAVLDHADALGFEEYHWQQGDPAKESFIPAF